MPVLSTKRMPVSALRSSRRGWPPLGLGLQGGKIGSMIAHRSSGKSGLAMVVSSGV
jgi:hypothetical protein